MNKRSVKITEAVGKILCHNVETQHELNGPYFRKGHVIKEEDIEQLQLIGTEHVYIVEMDSTDIHEDNASIRLAQAAAGPGIRLTAPVESKVNLITRHRGLLKINVRLLEQVNGLQDIVMATLPTNTVVSEGEKVAGTKIIPLAVQEKVITEAERLMTEGWPLVEVKPFLKKSVSFVVTGNEVKHRKVQDVFAPLLTEKINSFGSTVNEIDFSADIPDKIAGVIMKQVRTGADIIIVTGGLSADPDDTTPTGIRKAGADIVQYGAPVLPGAMFLLGYIREKPIMGIPVCGMLYRTTILDLILPRLLAGEKITKKDIQGFGHGGLCRSCDVCSYPGCSFGIGT